jgi:hypothetical protein
VKTPALMSRFSEIKQEARHDVIYLPPVFTDTVITPIHSYLELTFNMNPEVFYRASKQFDRGRAFPFTP